MSGGVTKSLSKSLIAIMINGGAHHLDLRYNNEYDPESVISTRALEVHYFLKWIKQTAFDWKWQEDLRPTKWTISACCVPKLVVSSLVLKLFYWMGSSFWNPGWSSCSSFFFFFVWLCVCKPRILPLQFYICCCLDHQYVFFFFLDKMEECKVSENTKCKTTQGVLCQSLKVEL